MGRLAARRRIRHDAVLVNARHSLPSEREREGDPRPAGFQDTPSAEHVSASTAALKEVASAVTMRGPTDGVVLRVTLCHVRHIIRYPFALYAFAPQTIGEDGRFEDAVASGRVLYAIVLNLPVSLQRESALAFLYDLVLRQQPIDDVRSGRRLLKDIPKLATSAEATSGEASSDILRFGWQEAARHLQRRAVDAGFRLEVDFRRDPFPERDDIVRRMPALRRLYDTNQTARDFVDRSASAYARTTSFMRGGPEAARQALQQTTELAGLRQFATQALRDADVCGNGYLTIGTFAGHPELRCARPDAVAIGPDGALVEHRTNGPVVLPPQTLHHRGLEQLDSPYGVSSLEPLLFALQQADIAAQARGLAEAALAASDVPAAMRERARQMLAVSDALEERMARHVAELTDLAERFLPPVVRTLYLRGQERYGED